MSKQRRSFPTAFKGVVAGLVIEQGYRDVEACRSVGVV